MEDRRRAVCRPKASGVWSVAWGVQLIHLDSYSLRFPTIPLFQAFQALFLDFFLIPCARVDSIFSTRSELVPFHFCFIFASSQDGLAVFQCLPYERWHHVPFLRLLHRSCDKPGNISHPKYPKYRGKHPGSASFRVMTIPANVMGRSLSGESLQTWRIRRIRWWYGTVPNSFASYFLIFF